MTTRIFQGALRVSSVANSNPRTQQAVLQVAASVAPPNAPTQIFQGVLRVAAKRPVRNPIEIGPVTAVFSSGSSNRLIDPYRIYLW